uniref:Uncharacterized protein n=1 Tax=Schizophyllum commune (strain H4-8 / FGSC 9210) TaxID=578458 RepID=D8Q9X8_SCHCM
MAVDFALYAIFILVYQVQPQRRHAHGSSYFTLAAILGLLLSSTISTVANAVFYVVEIPPYLGTSERGIEMLLLRLSIVITVAQDVNFVLSDAVLVSRAWRLWPYNRFVKGVLLLCVSATVGSIVECSSDFWRGLSTLGKLERNSQYFTRFIPLLTTNVVATALIGAKVLQYRRDIKGALGLLTQKTQTEAIIMLLLESGVAYVLFWVAGCVVQTVAVHDQFSSVRVFEGTYHHIARTPEEELASARRKQRKLDKKRRMEQPYSTKRVKTSTDYDYVFDIDGVPRPGVADYDAGPSQYYDRAFKPDPDVLRAEMEEQAFREKMFDALGDEERLDGIEAQFNDYAHVPNRWGGGSTTRERVYHDEDSFLHTDPQHLDEEEYAEWVRLGMYRRTHAAEYAEQERQKAAKAARKAEERARRKETRRLERAAEEERRLRRAHKDAMRFAEARERYEERWKELLAEQPTDAALLTFADIPWPVLAAHRHHGKDGKDPRLTVDDLTLDSISAFLLPASNPSKVENTDEDAIEEARKKERKERLRASYLRFHPDKFEGRLMKRVHPDHQEGVKEAVGAVVRALNTLMSED